MACGQDANNWLIDGGEAYDRGGGGILLVSPSQDALQEFTISTSNYAADLGNSSGGMISMAVKSGASGSTAPPGNISATMLWTLTPTFETGGKAKKPELRYNAFGFNLGGPLEFKSSNPKTFFFYNQEWRREINGGSIFNQVPTAARLAGNMTGLGTIYVPNTTDPVAHCQIRRRGLETRPAISQQHDSSEPYRSQLPLPILRPDICCRPTLRMGIHYFSSANTDTYYHEEIARVDHQFNE